MSIILAGLKKNYAGGAQKHMEIVSLDIIKHLYSKNHQQTISSIIELPSKQIDYIYQIATEYDLSLARDIERALNDVMHHNKNHHAHKCNDPDPTCDSMLPSNMRNTASQAIKGS